MTECKQLNDHDWLITITSEKKRWPWSTPVTEEQSYRGNCTVWHEYPEGTSCGTSMCGELNDIWTRAKWALTDEENNKC